MSEAAHEEILDIAESKPNHYWRTETPNIVWELGLKPYEMHFYAYLKRVAGDGGKCNKSRSTIQKECGISPSKQREIILLFLQPFDLLNGKPLIQSITSHNEKGEPNPTEVRIVDIWGENGSFYRKKKINKPAPGGGGGTPGGGGGTPGGGGNKKNPLKKNPLKKNNNNKPPAAAAPAVVVFSIFNELRISESLKKKLSSQMDEEKAQKLVQRVKSWKKRPSDAVGCNTVLASWDSWEDNVSKEERFEANKNWAQKSLKKYDDRQVGPYKCLVLSKHVEFCASGNGQPKCFNYEDPSFIESVKEIMRHNLGK
jgi:hypothetical protein